MAARHGCQAYQARHPLFGDAPSNMAILGLNNQCTVPALARSGPRKPLREPSQAALASLCASPRTPTLVEIYVFLVRAVSAAPTLNSSDHQFECSAPHEFSSPAIE